MNVITFPIKQCCECDARATMQLLLEDFDTGAGLSKSYCHQHFPRSLTEDELRLLCDIKDLEIERLKASKEDPVIKRVATDIAPDLDWLIAAYLETIGSEEDNVRNAYHTELTQFLWDNKFGLLRIVQYVANGGKEQS